MLIACSSTYGQDSKSNDPDYYKKLLEKYTSPEKKSSKADIPEFYKQFRDNSVDDGFEKIPSNESQKAGRNQYEQQDIFSLAIEDDDKSMEFALFSKRGYLGNVKSDSRLAFLGEDKASIKFEKDKIIVDILQRENRVILDTNKMEATVREKIGNLYHLDINSPPINYVLDEFIKAIKDSEEQKRYDKIYNACLLDKAKGMSMEVDSVRDAVEGACENIAKNPSWLDNWKYN